MRRFIISVLLVLFSFIAAWAVTNIVITVPIPEEKYTNIVNLASNKNTTIEEMLITKALQEIEDQRFSYLVELWQRAPVERQEAAIRVLRGQ
jgi:hypothetical protein